MGYVTASELSEHVHQDYLDKAETEKPGICEQTIKAVSGEIDDALRGRVALPLSTVPQTLKRVCGVIAAYRTIASITPLMDADGVKDEFLTLHNAYAECLKTLAQLREGKISLGLDLLGEKRVDHGGVSVVTSRKRRFGDKTWESY